MAWVAQISVFIYFRSPDSPNQDPNTLYIVSCSAQRHLLRAYILSLLCLSIPLSSNCCIARSNMQMHFMDTHNNIMQAELFFLSFRFSLFDETLLFFRTHYPIECCYILCNAFCDSIFFRATLLKTHYVYHYKNLGLLQADFLFGAEGRKEWACWFNPIRMLVDALLLLLLVSLFFFQIVMWLAVNHFWF